MLVSREDGVIVIRCLDFSTASHGDTLEEAMESIKSSIIDYLEYATARNSTDNIIDPEEDQFWKEYEKIKLNKKERSTRDDL